MDENGEQIPVDTRHGYYPDDIANTFGVPMEQHLKETEITEMDGFVNIAMFTGAKSETQDNQASADTKGVVRPDEPDDPVGGGDYSG